MWNTLLRLKFIKLKNRNRICAGSDSFQVRSRQTAPNGRCVQWESVCLRWGGLQSQWVWQAATSPVCGPQDHRRIMQLLRQAVKGHVPCQWRLSKHVGCAVSRFYVKRAEGRSGQSWNVTSQWLGPWLGQVHPMSSYPGCPGNCRRASSLNHGSSGWENLTWCRLWRCTP